MKISKYLLLPVYLFCFCLGPVVVFAGLNNIHGTEALISPPDGSTQLIQPVTLVWDSHPSAVWYNVQVDDDPAFGSPEYDVNHGNPTAEVSGLEDQTTYYWRTRFMHETTHTYTSWTDPWTFTVYENRRWYVQASAGASGDGSYERPFQDIKTGVNTAHDKDTVYIMNGTYTGFGNRNMNLNGKRLYIKGFSGPEGNIIDLQASEASPASAFIIQDGEDAGTVIMYLTIKNGYSTGGTIAIADGANPKIQSCIFEDNGGPTAGAIRLYNDCSANIAGCIFKGNYGEQGAAIVSSSDLIVSNSVFYDNHDATSTIMISGCGIDLRNNTFYHNSAEYGAALYTWQGEFNIDYNIFAFNHGDGAISRNGYVGTQSIENCLFYENDGGNFITIPEYEDNYDNIVGDPRFCNIEEDDIFIADVSPCAPANSPDGGLIGAKPVGCYFTDIADYDPALPAEFGLEQNFPNPFNPSTEISFALPERSETILTVYDILGRRVATLIDETLPAGTYRVEWDASIYPTGVYFCRLKAGEFTASRKMLFLK